MEQYLLEGWAVMFANAATARILGLPGCRELGLIMVLLEVKEKEHKRSNMAEEMNLPLPNPYLRLQTLSPKP